MTPSLASALDHARALPLTGVHNFRDYGDYPTRDGRRLKRGVLYRSGELAQATREDLTHIGSLGLSTFVDLRGLGERERAPSRFPHGFAPRVICSDGETSLVSAPHADAAQNSLDAAAARRNMRERYAGLPFRPLLVTVYRDYFEALASSDAPSLVCCSAGKDRTGLLVALLHHTLGVHWDDIVGDYLLTNTSGDVEARIDALRYDMTRRFGGPLPEESVRVVAMVEPEYLQTAFDAAVERHGSVSAYLEDVLAVTPQVREALAERLLV